MNEQTGLCLAHNHIPTDLRQIQKQSALDEFLKAIQAHWDVQTMETTATFVLPGLAAIPPQQGTAMALHFCVFAADTPSHVSQKTVRHLVSAFPETLLIFVYPDQLIDAWYPSPLDHSLVAALDIHWPSASQFWKLKAVSNPIALALQLDIFFGKQRVQRKFVLSFRQGLQALDAAWLNLTHPEDAMTLSFDTLIRLLFLAILQSRNTLDHRPDFLMEEITKTNAAGFNIYDQFIRPFFFGTLNVPKNKRAKRAKAFGDIPFLNGGLFQPTPAECRNPERSLPNDVLYRVCTDLICPWEFSDHETRHAHAALDPLMLGHVFEMLMTRELRAKTGTYYSPMTIVRSMVQRALSEWLCHHAQISREEAANLFAHGLCPQLSVQALKQIHEALVSIRVLDIAAGSGAFLQEASEAIHRARTALEHGLGIDSHPASLARNILLHNIFGVDILETANRICELRLWLSTLKYYDHDEKIPPLPNLDMNIRCGHALIDLTQYALAAGTSVRDIMASEKASATKLRNKYKRATGRTKQILAKHIEALDNNIENAVSEHLQMKLQSEIKELTTAFGQKNLFGEKQLPAKNIKQQIEALRSHLKTLNTHNLPAAFSFEVHFPEAMIDGGFDVLLGNPPWFSLHTRPKHEQQALKALYQTAKKFNNGRVNAQSIDISALFVEKSIQLARPNGVIAMLLPNKLFSAPSYEAFRCFVAKHTRLVDSHDWSNSPDNAFDACTYPADIVLRKLDAVETQTNAWLTDIDAHASGKLQKRQTEPVLQTTRNTVGTRFTLKRGLYTCANDVFLCDTQPNCASEFTQAHFLCLPKGQTATVETSQLFPILRGADIDAFHASPSRFFLLTHKRHDLTQVDQALPSKTYQWLLEKCDRRFRHQGQSADIARVFGISPLIQGPKVVWRDIASDLTACYLPERDLFALNTVYYIPVPDDETGYLLSGFLNASPVRQFCRQRAEHARGDYRRFLAWVVADIPWPFQTLSQQHPIARQIIEISKHAHAHGMTPRLQTKLDACVLKALSCTP